MSTSNGAALPSTFSHPVTEKLSRSNYALWKLQVLPAIRGAQLVDYITLQGSVQGDQWQWRWKAAGAEPSILALAGS